MHNPCCADCCPTGNKVVFQIPMDSCDLGHKQRAHFNFTSDGVGDLARDEPGQLMPASSEQYPGIVYDFPKQVIKLRIGRTIEMPGRKSKLEYQFITPVITHEKVVPVKDTRTAQCVPASCSTCCPMYPRCTSLLLPPYKELTKEQKLGLILSINPKRISTNDLSNNYSNGKLLSYLNYSEILDGFLYMPIEEQRKFSFLTDAKSKSLKKERLSQKQFNKPDCDWKSYISVMSLPIRDTGFTNTGLFGTKETSVYMTLSDNICRLRTSGTQATASINKCLQVTNERLPPASSTIDTNSDYCSTCTMSTLPNGEQRRFIPEHLINSKIYFFGRKRDDTKQKGMGSKASQTKLQRTSQTSTHEMRSNRTPSKTNLQTNPRVGVKPTLPSKNSKGAATAAGSSKTVTIKDDKSQKPCPALGTTKGDMMVTVSHIRIGPKEMCPVHGSDPCQGPKCILASSGEEQGPVKVTSVNNPRRGVFEIVVRKLTGAPLAKNELMLEWTPPPSRSPPCPGPCPNPCLPPGSYRPSKCKLIVCRPSPCRPKFCKKKPCGPTPCRGISCKSVVSCRKCCRGKCCGKACQSCKPCPPPSCCPPLPCRNPCLPPCSKPPCTSPCKSSPCLRPCPVGRKRPRRSRSQPRVKSHRKRISPCCNRSRTCPIVRSRSVPGPCIRCCSVPPFCLPRKCCSVLPCKPPKSCISSCSTCCG